jgi:hypothetical protein
MDLRAVERGVFQQQAMKPGIVSTSELHTYICTSNVVEFLVGGGQREKRTTLPAVIFKYN